MRKFSGVLLKISLIFKKFYNILKYVIINIIFIGVSGLRNTIQVYALMTALGPTVPKPGVLLLYYPIVRGTVNLVSGSIRPVSGAKNVGITL